MSPIQRERSNRFAEAEAQIRMHAQRVRGMQNLSFIQHIAK